MSADSLPDTKTDGPTSRSKERSTTPGKLVCNLHWTEVTTVINATTKKKKTLDQLQFPVPGSTETRPTLHAQVLALVVDWWLMPLLLCKHNVVKMFLGAVS